MDIEVGQIWVSTYMDNWFVRVKEFYKHNGRVEYIDDDGEVGSAHVTNFIDEFEFVRNKGDDQMVKPKYPSSIRTKGLAVKTDDKGVITGIVHHKENAPKPDMVNKPPHYKDASGIECKEITCHRKMPFSLGNAIKYLYRAGSKGDLLEDLKKAEWYLRVAYLNDERVPKAVEVRLLEVAAVRKTAAGRALNAIRLHEVSAAYQSVKSEIERLEAGSD